MNSTRNMQHTIASALKSLREDQIVSPDDLLRTAVEKLQTNHTSCVCVVDADKVLLGVITDGDLRRVLFKSGGQTLAQIFATPLHRVATGSPHVVAPSQTLQAALRIMHEHRIGALPVVEKGHLKGIINMQDIVEYFGFNS